MANVWGTPSYKRIMWNAATDVANSTTKKVAGRDAIHEGTFGIFWPVNEAGVLGQGQTVNGIWATYSDGTTEKLPVTLVGSTKGTITLTNGYTADRHRIVTFEATAVTVGLQMLELEVEEWDKASYGQLEAAVLDLQARVAVLEEGTTP